MMRLLAGLALAALLQGCTGDPYARMCTTERPETNDVVGRYTLTEQTLAGGGIAALQGRPCIVDLAADGSFIASNIPPYTAGAPPIRSLKSLVSGSGKWRLDAVGSVDTDGSGKMKTHWGVRLDSRTVKLDAPGLISNQPPYGLLFSIGNPDEHLVMIFERSQ